MLCNVCSYETEKMSSVFTPVTQHSSKRKCRMSSSIFLSGNMQYLYHHIYNIYLRVNIVLTLSVVSTFYLFDSKNEKDQNRSETG